MNDIILAQTDSRTINLGQTQGNKGIPANTTSLQTILTNAITLIFTVAAILVLAMLIWGAVEWVLSGGDKEKVANARKRVTNALIGLAIIALIFVIVRVVGQIVGFHILNNLQIPSLNTTTSTTSTFTTCTPACPQGFSCISGICQSAISPP